MAGLPKKLYYVLLKPGGKPLGYREKGGGKYTDEAYAKGQYTWLKNRGSKVELYVGEVSWSLLEPNETEVEENPELW